MSDARLTKRGKALGAELLGTRTLWFKTATRWHVDGHQWQAWNQSQWHVDVMTDAIKLASAGTSALYVSFHTDGIDAAYAPGTSGLEPGGLTSREVLTAVRMLGEHSVTMFDTAEYCPAYVPSDITGKLCCYIIFNVLGALRETSASLRLT